VALVNTILDQRGVNQVEMAPLSQQPRTLKELAALAKRKKQRKTRMAIVITIVSVLGVLSLAIGIPTYLSVQKQQRAERDTQLLQNHFRQLARQPYAVHVPGEHCGNGKNVWLDDDSTNVYTCQKDGLLMTQKNTQYVDGEWFTFVPDTLSTTSAFSSVGYFPHNYRVQVKATILSGGPGTCVAVAVHFHNFLGDQSFDLCANGSWAYYRCDLQCKTYELITSGNLPLTSTSYLTHSAMDNLTRE
jgi:predicted HD phosphohydrolase